MSEELSEIDLIEAALGQKRCRCCRRMLRAGTIADYCKRIVCRQQGMAQDVEFRDRIYATNNAWHKKKMSEDPLWAEQRREKNRLRMAKKRAEKKTERQAEGGAP